MSQPTFDSRFGSTSREWTPVPIEDACRNWLTIAIALTEDRTFDLRDRWVRWCQDNPQHGYDDQTAAQVFWDVLATRRVVWQRGPVHNHGPEDFSGPGIACPEVWTAAGLKGACMYSNGHAQTCANDMGICTCDGAA